jgi:hypothetical protein
MPGHLIHIGYPKAGSTTLQAWFEGHPQLRYAPNSLGGYYHAVEIAAPAESAPAWYVTSSQGYSTPRAGDVPARQGFGYLSEPLTPIVARRAAICEALRALFAGSTILIVTRGFRGILASGYSEYVRGGGALALRDVFAADAPVEDYYDYDAVVRLYEEAFGEERVVVLPYELLRDDPDSFLGTLERRLAIEHADLPPALNPSLTPTELYWYPRISRLVAGILRRLARRHFDRLYKPYVALTIENRLRGVVALLDRLQPGRRLGPREIPEDLVERCRGRAAELARRPLYGPYAAEYLND